MDTRSRSASEAVVSMPKEFYNSTVDTANPSTGIGEAHERFTREFFVGKLVVVSAHAW